MVLGVSGTRSPRACTVVCTAAAERPLPRFRPRPHNRSGAEARKARSTRSSQTRTPGTRIVVRPRLRASAPRGRPGASGAPRACARSAHHRRGRARRGCAATHRPAGAPVDLADPLSAARSSSARADGARRCPGVKPERRHSSTRIVLIECSAFFAAMNRKIIAGSRCPWRRGRGFSEDLALLGERADLAPQPAQLLTLVRSGPRLCPRRHRAGAPSSEATAASTQPRRARNRLPSSSRTASRRNSSEYGGMDGMNTDPCCHARRPSDQVSTKAGELHPWRLGRRSSTRT